MCDCCDGSDEAKGICNPSCDEASKAWINRLADRYSNSLTLHICSWIQTVLEVGCAVE